MTERERIEGLLGSSREDAGCDGAMARLAEYVEGELAGRDVDELYPTVAEHLRNCSACAEDHEGLVVLARDRR